MPLIVVYVNKNSHPWPTLGFTWKYMKVYLSLHNDHLSIFHKLGKRVSRSLICISIISLMIGIVAVVLVIFVHILLMSVQISLRWENLVTRTTFHVHVACFMLFQPLQIRVSSWVAWTAASHTHKHPISNFLMHQSDVISQICFYNCPVWAVVTVILLVFIYLLTVKSLMSIESDLSLQDFSTSFTGPALANCLVMNSLQMSQYWAHCKMFAAFRASKVKVKVFRLCQWQESFLAKIQWCSENDSFQFNW